MSTVPNSSRLFCSYSERLENGVPKGNRPWFSHDYTKYTLTSGNYSYYLMLSEALARCSQKQTTANPRKQTGTTGPNLSRVLELSDCANQALLFARFPSIITAFNQNSLSIFRRDQTPRRNVMPKQWDMYPCEDESQEWIEPVQHEKPLDELTNQELFAAYESVIFRKREMAFESLDFTAREKTLENKKFDIEMQLISRGLKEKLPQH